MSKYLMLGDTHIGLYNNSPIWHEISKNLFIEIHDFCIRNDITTIIHGGDFYHERKQVNTKSIQLGIDIVEMFEDLEMIFIIGNHDIYYKNKIHPTSLDIFKKHKNVRIIDKITEFNNILLVPWLTNDVSRVFKTNAEYCFGHFETKGFKMNDNFVCNKGEDINTFKQFKQVYSSHFHTPSYSENMVYLGSPYPQTFHDVDSKRGYYIWNDGILDFIEFNKCPKFRYIRASKKIEKNDIEGNIIQLKFNKDFGTNENEKIIETYRSYNPLLLTFDFSSISNEMDEVLDENIGVIAHNQIIQEYILKTKTPENINKQMLVKIFNNIVNEIKGE